MISQISSWCCKPIEENVQNMFKDIPAFINVYCVQCCYIPALFLHLTFSPSITSLFTVQIRNEECSVYDPKFTTQEKEMLSKFGFSVISHNEVRFYWSFLNDLQQWWSTCCRVLQGPHWSPSYPTTFHSRPVEVSSE